MRTLRFLFVMMVASPLLAGTSRMSKSDFAPQETGSQTGEKSPGDNSSNTQKQDENRGEEGQPSPARPEGRKHLAGVTHTVVKHPSVSHSKPVRNHQTDQATTAATSNPFLNMPASVRGLQHTGSGTVLAPPVKATTRGSSAPPRANVAVNGQQFKNSREPGAHLTASGGPLTSPRGIAAINGTNIKPKH